MEKQNEEIRILKALIRDLQENIRIINIELNKINVKLEER